MKNANTPAMPLHDAQQNMEFVNTEAQGFTKREYFAAIAMQGLCSACDKDGTWQHDAKLVAGVAVEYADAMLEELERTNESD